jgi:hypothetical protein
MPIAKDDGTRAAPKNVDEEIRSLLGGYGAAPSPNPVKDALASYGPSTPNFNPAADISAGRVSDIPIQLGQVAATRAYENNPVRGAQQQTAGLLGLAAVVDSTQKRQAKQAEAEQDERPAPMALPGARERVEDRKNPRGGYEAKVVDSLRERVGNVGMYTGALTVLPEIENAEQTGSTGVPAWDNAIDKAMGRTPSTPQEPSFGAGARAGSSIRLEDVQQQQADELEADGIHDRLIQRKALGKKQGRTTELTSEEYDKLSPKQRAAVDLNTLLVTAVREDLAAKKRGTDAGGKEYDAAVAEVFGEKGAAEARFAPKTMRLLDDIDFKGEGTNLNDVLKLKVGLNVDDIADLEREQTGPDIQLETSMSRRDDLTEALVKSFRSQRRDPQKGAALLETQRDILGTRDALDFGSPENNQLIEGVFEMLANPSSEVPFDKLMAETKATLTDEHWQLFIKYLDTRSREAQQYKNPLGLDPEADYMGARRFRRRAGL